MQQKECRICRAMATKSNPEIGRTFWECPVCGRYELIRDVDIKNTNHLASYFCYNGFDSKDMDEYRYFTFGDKELCDTYNEKFNEGNNIGGRPVHLSEDDVAAWYPKKFSEKIDMILLYMYRKTQFIGEVFEMSTEEMESAFFIDRLLDNQRSYGNRDELIRNQLQFIKDYLTENKLCIFNTRDNGNGGSFLLSAKAYARIDELNKDSSNSREVLVAMKFGDDTSELREAIREGIRNAHYQAIFIDEVEHNDLITPELLKHIRDSKFVVVDLTHKNNGAYFEEGYAMGLGKSVIQLCKSDVDLHFDIAQKNTIIWTKEEDIPIRLTNRIKATID